jgi:uncharacterized protein YndB with AHSA1/START domain
VEKEIVTEIEINAPPSRVWEILTDFEKDLEPIYQENKR